MGDGDCAALEMFSMARGDKVARSLTMYFLWLALLLKPIDSCGQGSLRGFIIPQIITPALLRSHSPEDCCMHACSTVLLHQVS